MPPPSSRPVSSRPLPPEIQAVRDRTEELSKRLEDHQKEIARLKAKLEELADRRDDGSFWRTVAAFLGAGTAVATLVGVHRWWRDALKPKGRED